MSVQTRGDFVAVNLNVDHTRGLCSLPDVSPDTAKNYLKACPAHCECCGAEMVIQECANLSMQQLGVYWFLCPECPEKEAKLRRN